MEVNELTSPPPRTRLLPSPLHTLTSLYTNPLHDGGAENWLGAKNLEYHGVPSGFILTPRKVHMLGLGMDSMII